MATALATDPHVRARDVLWLKRDDDDRIQLAVSTPLVQEGGVQKAYLGVRKRLVAEGLLDAFPLELIWVLDSRHPVLMAIRHLVGSPEFTGRLVINTSVVEDVFVNFAVVYRLMPPEKRKAGTRKK